MSIFLREMEWDSTPPKVESEKQGQELSESNISKTSMVESQRQSQEFGESNIPKANGHQGQPPLVEDIPRRHGHLENSKASFSKCHIDLDYLQKIGMVTPNLGNNQIIEEYRYIKRPLLATAFKGDKDANPSGNNNVIVVTSTLPGEGKTFTSLNLAMSVAMEKDKTVLLVDADLEQTGLTQLLDLSRRIGLSHYLMDPSLELGQLLLKSENVPKLTLLPSGAARRDSAEILGSKKMDRLIEELSWRYSDRIIIVDAPPLLASSSASILAQLAGQTIMVVASGQTSTGSLDEALTKLDGDQNVRLILNKAQYSWKSGHYAYGDYGYKKSNVK